MIEAGDAECGIENRALVFDREPEACGEQRGFRSCRFRRRFGAGEELFEFAVGDADFGLVQILAVKMR